MNNLPYIYIDNELDLNAISMLLVLDRLSYNKNDKPKLDFGKLQIFLYLLRNPTKINPLLMRAGKNTGYIDKQYTHTIDSLSTNIDILHDRSRLRTLIKRLACSQLLSVERSQSGEICYIPTPEGKKLASEISDSYFNTLKNHLEYLKSVQSFSTTKLLSLLNLVFQENI